MIKVYQKQPITFEQFDGSEEMIDKLLGTNYVFPNMGVDDETDSNLLFATKGGFLELKVGDWIATDVNSAHCVIDDNTFQKTYSELPVIPDCVAEYIRDSKSIEDNNVIKSALGAIDYDQSNYIVADWIIRNGDDFACAWRYGYQVEEQHD